MENNVFFDSIVSEAEGVAEVYNKLDFQAFSGEIFFITSYPPRECGIASYSQNLISALNTRFNNFFQIKVCALENGNSKYYYPSEVTSILNTSNAGDYERIADEINRRSEIQAIVLQHEFDLFKPNENSFIEFLNSINKPKVVVFHTVISNPSEQLKNYIHHIASIVQSIVVLAKVSENILINEYNIPESQIEVIPYGTFHVPHFNVHTLKEKHHLEGKTVLSHIGLLSPGKGIETILDALPAIIKKHSDVLLLIVGKTHPEELKKNGENYRIMLESKAKTLKLQNNVRFLNGFFSAEILKEYFQLSDICVFSATDTNRPMSGMFSLAVSCGCTVISTPTPHAHEFLQNDACLIFQSSNELTEKVNQLLDDCSLRKSLSNNILRKSQSAVWENSALLHGSLFNKIAQKKAPYNLHFPDIRLDFLKSLTDRVGILHATYKGEPDIRSGYTLDDNALALFVFCLHYKNTGDTSDLPYIKKYVKFISHCYQPSGVFFKYLDYERKFTVQNYQENLEETQAKTIWALGYLFSMKELLSTELIDAAGLIMENVLHGINKLSSLNSISFAIKGLYYYFSVNESYQICEQIRRLADKLMQSYHRNSQDNWLWFEKKISSTASIIPGALLNTWLITGDQSYKNVARESFNFLSSKIFKNSDTGECSHWQIDNMGKNYGEQPVDIAFNVITLSKFYLMLKDNEYFLKMDSAFKWFLGCNRLKQMVYNPISFSCFDGLEQEYVNQNQSALSALSYTIARLVVEKYKFKGENHISNFD